MVFDASRKASREPPAARPGGPQSVVEERVESEAGGVCRKRNNVLLRAIEAQPQPLIRIRLPSMPDEVVSADTKCDLVAPFPTNPLVTATLTDMYQITMVRIHFSDVFSTVHELSQWPIDFLFRVL
jgi:hypothetical protein